MRESVIQPISRVTSHIQKVATLVLFSSLIPTLFLFELGKSTFCPVTSPNDEVVYVTDTPTKLMIGATKTGCAIDCLYSNCRCINYNVTSLNCSVFNFEPKSYAVDKTNNTVAYQLIEDPLKRLWSTVPVTNCSFPFIYQGLNYCGCRRGVVFPNDQYCKKSYYSCQLKNGNSAYCKVADNSPVKTIGCSLNSSCTGTSADFPCTCNAGYTGDGFTCTAIFKPRDCADIQSNVSTKSGVYTVYIGSTLRPLVVYCDMTTTSGGWTVFQRRRDGSVDFYRNWTDYAHGFGDVRGEHWIGNNNLNVFTTDKRYKLRIDLTDFDNNTRYAEYNNFTVQSSNDKYRLTSIGTYTGNAGKTSLTQIIINICDSLFIQLGQQFSKYDQDNDAASTKDCAVVYKGAWWYKNCHWSNLNGFYYGGPHTSYADGVAWSTWTGLYYSLKTTEMKIKPVI